MSQLPLFDAAPSPETAERDLAPVAEGAVALAARLPASLRMGTMSWTFPGWLGVLYREGLPKKALADRGLAAYARHPLLRAVEIDRSYYEPLTKETYARYAALVPDDFRFVVKAHEETSIVRFPMHPRYGKKGGADNPLFLDAEYASRHVVEPYVEGLGSKAGPLVFQFPPAPVESPRAFADQLHAFLRKLPKGPTYVVEVRNAELVTPAYAAALVDTGVMHCHNAWGRMPGVLTQHAQLPAETRAVLVARWLMHADDTYEAAAERYTPFARLVDEDEATRNDLATLVHDATRGTAPAFVVVNNKAEGCAPESIFKLAERIASPQPPF